MNLADQLEFFKDMLLSTSRRTVSLRWPAKASAQLSSVVLAQRAIVSEGISEGFEGKIAGFVTDPNLPEKLLIGMPFALTMTTDSGTERSFPMIITEASMTRSSTDDLTVVNIVGRDPMSIMNERRQLRVIKDATVEGAVREVLSDWVTNSPIGPSFTYRFLSVDSSQYARRACFLQHPDESDTQFIERLLSGDGKSYYWGVKSDSQPGIDVPMLELVIFDSQLLLSANDTPSMSYWRHDGVQAGSSLSILASVNRLVPAGIDVESWDHETGELASSSADANIDQGEQGNDLARSLRSTRYAIDHLGNDAADLDRLANVQANHYGFRSHGLRGRGNVRTMSPGTYQVIEDYPPFAGRSVDDRTYTTIKITHVAENNTPAELHDAAQALVGNLDLPDWAKADASNPDDQSKHRYTNQFYCVPRDTPIQPAYVEEREQPRRRRLTGIVIAAEGMEITCDALGRMLVRLLGGKPGADTTMWVRADVQWGGKGYGYHGVLRAGTEVDLELLGPDRLVIVGVRYNAKTPHPRFDHRGSLPNNASQSGIVSRELNGDRTQQLRFVDRNGSISVQVGTDHAATQLNIGALSTPMDEGEIEPRGEGFEIRTDKAGALRSAEAMLVSAWGRLHACDTQLSAGEHLSLMNDLMQLCKHLGQYAADQQGLPTDTEPQTKLGTDVQGGTAPTLSLTAPAGVATTTSQTIVNYAGINIDTVAQQHLQFAAGGSYVVNTMQGASIFAQQGGIRLLANHGKLLMQSQHDDTDIDAAKNITLSAVGGKLVGQAQDEIMLMTKGGAYLKLSGGDVELGGPGSLNVKTDGHNWCGPSSASAQMNLQAGEPKPPYDEMFIVKDKETGEPVAFVPYQITDGNGKVLGQGITDEKGRAQRVHTDGAEDIGIFY